jgi:pimeloyl-ACP methyl ester carboxylesterase
MANQVVILPGLDGTDLLLQRFVERAPSNRSTTVIRLPDRPSDDYESLCSLMSARVQALGHCHLIAESFSGPLGIMLARQLPELVDRLTLVASFVESPLPRIARWIPWSLNLRAPIPLVAIRYLLVGNDRDPAIEVKHAIRQTSVSTLAKRLRSLSSVDVRSQLASLHCPVDYIRPNHDRLVTQRSVDRIKAVCPRVIVHEIDGPHLILQTRPAESWAVILRGDGQSVFAFENAL